MYFEDILAVSGSWKEHVVHLGRLFEALKEAGFKCKRKKCSSGSVKLDFLGHIVGVGVISVPEARVREIREHLYPKSRKQPRAYLGLIGF